jgi:hypothetical protein
MALKSRKQGRSKEPIKITEDKKVRDGWHYLVVIGGPTNPTHHYVTVEESFWRTMTKEELKPEELVRLSFEFLLARESKHAILTSFNLNVINQYFPEYETRMRDMLSKR